MNVLPIIMAFVFAYGFFVFAGYKLARVFFPSINSGENHHGTKSKRIKGKQVRRLAS